MARDYYRFLYYDCGTRSPFDEGRAHYVEADSVENALRNCLSDSRLSYPKARVSPHRYPVVYLGGIPMNGERRALVHESVHPDSMPHILDSDLSTPRFRYKITQLAAQGEFWYVIEYDPANPNSWTCLASCNTKQSALRWYTALCTTKPIVRDSNARRIDVLRRWPRIAAHIMSESLGYASPETAAYILLTGKFNEPCWCEWADACWNRDGRAILRHSIKGRKHHEGFMAHYSDRALPMVRNAVQSGGQTNGMLAAWF